MEWVDGIQFEEEEWDKLSLEIQHKLCYKIGLQLQKLRSIQPPQPRYYGRINNQCFDHFRYPIAGYRRHERAGPFYTYDSYLERLFTYSKWSSVLCIMVTEPDAENVPAGARFVSSMWLEQFSHEEQVCEPKLTHGDVKLRNMVFVKPPKDDQGKIEDLDVILIDWESLAWEPAWYEIEELTTAFAAFSDSDIDASWMSYLGFAKAIKPFPYTEALAGRAMLANMNVH